jgi:hypothetical protein
MWKKGWIGHRGEITIMMDGRIGLIGVATMTRDLNDMWTITWMILTMRKMLWEMMILSRGDHFRFGSGFTFKKQPNWKKRDPNRTGTGPNRPVSVRFGSGFWGPKPEKPLVIFLAPFWLCNGLCNMLLVDF